MPETRIEIEAEDGCVDALAAWPDGEGRRPPVVLLDGGPTAGLDVWRFARRLAARGYFVLAPEWRTRPAAERRADAEAWLDYLAYERRADDTRVGVAGWGAGADLALKTAAWRAERIAAVAAFHGRGFGAGAAVAVAQRLNALVHLGYLAGAAPGRGMAALEAALCAADAVFEVETYARGDEPTMRAKLLDLFDRTLTTQPPELGMAALAAPR